MTTRKELFDIFDEITEKAFEIMQGKNSDYASDEDSLANFRSSEVLNVDPRKALLIRMLDKIKRQVNYIERGELSVDSAEDDVIDLINYSVLLHTLNREKEFEEAYEATKDKIPSFSKADRLLGKVLHDNYDLDSDQYEIRPELRDEIESYFNDVPEFCDTPNACYYDGCSCDRTNKGVELVQVNLITEQGDLFLVNRKGQTSKFISDEKVKDVKTDDELTITQLETTDGTIYRV